MGEMGKQVQLDAGRRAPALPRTRALEPGEVAWLTVLPIALALLLATVLLGPPLGHAIFEPTGAERFWPEAEVLPEPVEHARFVIALLGVPPAAAAVVVSRRWSLHMRPPSTRLAIAVTQGAIVVFLAVMLLAQRSIFIHAHAFSPLPGEGQALFNVRTLLAATALTVALAGTLGRRAAVQRLAALTRETPARRVTCAAIAALVVALWLLAAINTEQTIGRAEGRNLIPWNMSETFAVLDGRTPLVDFHSQYAQLFPHLAAWVARAIGVSVTAWTATMVACSGLALLAVYAVFRRVVRGPLLALALFVPFVATSASLIAGIVTPVEIFSIWPMRYGGPYLLAWLTARRLDGAVPRRRWLLLIGGLIAVNNLEFGVPALAGTLAALLFADPPRSRRALLALATDLAGGLLAAIALVSAFTLLRAGELPHFGLLLEFPRLYGIGGWVLEPMPSVGFHLVMYATYAAAILVATVRAVRGEEQPVLTGMLAWSGVFGLGASSYYAGRSDEFNLVSLFSAWCLALTLLTVAVVGSLARMSRRPSPAELAVLFCFGLSVCSIFQLPRPWVELDRLQRTTAPVYKQRDAIRLVTATTRPGERVVILAPLGHRIAYDAGVVDVAPYASAESMPSATQLDTTFEAMGKAGVTHVFLDTRATYAGLYEALVAAGYREQAHRGRYMSLTNAPLGP